jgi:hypothetical protein
MPDDTQALPWPALDRRFLHAERPSPPLFPLEVFADPWRPWLAAHAQSAPCADYIALSLLGAVSAVCGSRFVVDVTPHWREPLVLWQALVGAPSTGKSAALVAARRLLGGVKGPEEPAGLPADAAPENQRSLTTWILRGGFASWYDDLDAWLPLLSRNMKERVVSLAAWTGAASHFGECDVDVGKDVYPFALSVAGTLQADRLVETLSDCDEALTARFLYSWPLPRVEVRLDRPDAEAGGDLRPLVQRLVDLPGSFKQPIVLQLDEAAADRLEARLPELRRFMREADGLEAAWIGKAGGTIVRLAGLLTLMDWAADKQGNAPPPTIDEDAYARAERLWTDYFWPHAQGVFGQAALTLTERRVRRVGRWLARIKPEMVSLRELRREALGASVDAEETAGVIERLERYGALRVLDPEGSRNGGPRRHRWQVNPELFPS